MNLWDIVKRGIALLIKIVKETSTLRWSRCDFSKLFNYVRFYLAKRFKEMVGRENGPVVAFWRQRLMIIIEEIRIKKTFYSTHVF